MILVLRPGVATG